MLRFSARLQGSKHKGSLSGKGLTYLLMKKKIIIAHKFRVKYMPCHVETLSSVVCTAHISVKCSLAGG